MKKLSLLSLFLLLASAPMGMRASCEEPCLPLKCSDRVNCGCLSTEFHAGLVPTVWTDRGCINAVACELQEFDKCPVVSLGKQPKFRDLFRLPWTVGGRIHYAPADCMLTYFEANYIQARDKAFCLHTRSADDVQETQSIAVCHDKYKAYNAYVGARRYFEGCMCESANWFIGMKVGLIHHKEINANLVSLDVVCDSDLCCDGIALCNNACGLNACDSGCGVTRCKVLYDANTTISGGGEVGLDWCLNSDLSFVVTVGFLGNGGLKPACDIRLDQAAQGSEITDIVLGCFSTEVQFPIQFGLRFTF